MQIVYAVLTLDSNHREEALEHTRELARQSRNEPGIVDYRVGIDVEDEHVLRFVERYRDEEAVEAHLKTDHYAAFEDAVIPDMLSDDPEILQFEASVRA